MRKRKRRSGAERNEQNRYRETGGTVYRDPRNSYRGAYPERPQDGRYAGNSGAGGAQRDSYPGNGRQNSYSRSGAYQSYAAEQAQSANPYQARGERSRLERRSGQSRADGYSGRSAQELRAFSADYYMYTANAVAEPYEEEALPAAKPKTKPKHRARGSLLRNLSALLIVFLLGLALVAQYAYIQNLGYQVGQSKAELQQVEEQNEKLRRQISAAGELQAVEAYAIYTMGMHKPGEGEILYLPKPDPAPETEPAKADAE